MNTVEQLPDPRSSVKVYDNSMDEAAMLGDEALQAALLAALCSGNGASIRTALRNASPAMARRVWHALNAVVDGGGDGDGIGLRLFAIPVVIVAGARTAMTLPGAVAEIAKIVDLLVQHGAVGATRNFGLGNALCSAQALENIAPDLLWRAARDPADRAVADSLLPEPVVVSPGREQVHLRFLVGAGVTPQNLPSFLQSASNIGTWGMPLTKELARQLAQPGLEILPMPRPPQLLVKAAYVGRCAQLEAALSLFLGNAVRDFRMSVGDPQAVISAHQLEGGAGELRLSLSSPFDDSLLEGFCWPLHPLDEVGEIAPILIRALTDCRINDVVVIERVLPAALDRGLIFISARAADSHVRGAVSD